jgi:acetolactate synthase I/II/III large subunit
VIVAGGGVRVAQAYDDLARLAREVAAPVATTAGGKGVFAETDELALGVFGNFGTPLANAVVGAADVVLAVGTKLGPSDTALGHPDLLDPTRQTLVHVDLEPANLSWTLPADLAITGDARVALARLGEAAAGSTSAEARRQRLDALGAGGGGPRPLRRSRALLRRAAHTAPASDRRAPPRSSPTTLSCAATRGRTASS